MTIPEDKRALILDKLADHVLANYPLTNAWLHTCVQRPALVQLRAQT